VLRLQYVWVQIVIEKINFHKAKGMKKKEVMIHELELNTINAFH